jgi:hypothetical protein
MRLTQVDSSRIAVLFLSICLLSAFQCKKSGGDIEGDDNSKDHIAPAAISDLTVANMTVSGISLEWSAPGDDGDSGRATSYEIRYSPALVTEESWGMATVVPFPPVPNIAGSTESFAVTGLQAESTYYFSIRTTDNEGNQSGVSNSPWGVCFDNYEVAVADSNLEALLRFYLEKPDSALHRIDLLAFCDINASGHDIANLSGLEYCRRLQSLNLWNNSVHDLSPVVDLPNLLDLRIGYNGLSDISALRPMTQLRVLCLNANSIEGITALTDLTNLEELNLTANRIWVLTPLVGKSKLKRLYLDGNQIVFVNALYNLTGIEKLDLSRNQITDISLLLHNAGLGAGDSLWLTDNPLGPSTIDTVIPQLQTRGVTVIR